jgi:hypothetical protein
MSAFTLSNLPLPLVMRPGPSEKTSNKNGTVFYSPMRNRPDSQEYTTYGRSLRKHEAVNERCQDRLGRKRKRGLKIRETILRAFL